MESNQYLKRDQSSGVVKPKDEKPKNHHDASGEPYDTHTEHSDSQQRFNIFVLLLVGFSLNCCVSPATVHVYVAQAFPFAGVWFSTTFQVMYYSSQLIAGTIADNFLGRYELLTASAGLLSVTLIVMAVGITRAGMDLAATIVWPAFVASYAVSLIPLLGDQARTGAERRISFAALKLANMVGQGCAYFVLLEAYKYQCIGTRHCFFALFLTGGAVLAALFLLLLRLKKRLIRQLTVDDSVVKAVVLMILYSFQMRINSRESQKSIMLHAEELDPKIAKDLRRVGRNFFHAFGLAISTLYYISSQNFRNYQSADLNGYHLFGAYVTMIDYNRYLYMGYILVCLFVGAYVCLFCRNQMTVVCEILVVSGLVVASTATTLAIEWYRAGSGHYVNSGHVRVGMLNSLNCSVTFGVNQGQTRFHIPMRQVIAFDLDSHNINMTSYVRCDNQVVYKYSLSTTIHHSMNAAIIGIYRSNISFRHEIYSLKEQKVHMSAALFGYKRDIKVLHGGREIRSHLTVGQNGSKLNKWILRPMISDVFNISTPDRYLELKPNIGSIYGLFVNGDYLETIEVLPGGRPSRALQWIPTLVDLTFYILLDVVTSEFVYTQAPAHMRSLLLGLVTSSTALSSMILALISKGITLDQHLYVFGSTGVLAVIALVYGAWKLRKMGLCEIDPVVKENWI